MTSTGYFYGEAPTVLGEHTLAWDEFMHYLYLPVRIPARDDARVPLGIDCDAHQPATGPQYALPERLGFLGPIMHNVIHDARRESSHLTDPYVYVTARRGYATPGNPLNRPGWHCDDFGGTDLNYVWSDAYPTRFLQSTTPLNIPEDDAASMIRMDNYAAVADGGSLWIEEYPDRSLLRLTPWVIHDTPIIPAPGGMRSFFKISVSTHRYDLLGNSHNYLLDYDWPMHDRASVRNQPAGNGDYTKGAPAL